MWNSVLFDLTEAAMTYVSGGTGSYTFDATGNRTKTKHVAGSASWTRYQAYATDSNRLTSSSLPGDAASGPYSQTYAYSDRGSMTGMPAAANSA